METQRLIKCNPSSGIKCTRRTVDMSYLSIGLLLMLSVMHLCVPPSHADVPRQIEISYTLVEEQNSPNSFIANLLREDLITDAIPPDQLQDVHFQYLSDVPPFFHIETTGIITVSELVDREALCPQAATCEVQIDLAIQPITPFTMVRVRLIILDVNDNAPRFEEASITRHVLESTQPGSSFVLPSLTDPDSPDNGVTAVRLQTPVDGPFELRTVYKPDGSRELRLVLTAPLDREAAAEYRLPVTATDGGDPPRSGTLDITVLVTDANDNHPQFERDTYEVTLAENAAPGALVTTVHATDLDSGPNGRVLYRLSADTAAELGAVFSIHNVSGAVTVASAGGLDYEAAAILYLTVEAVDRGADPVPGEAVVIVHVEDVNDHAPAITVHTLGGPGVQHTAVTEGTQTGTFVARVVVTDRDDGDNGQYECDLYDNHFKLGALGEDYLVTSQGDIDREDQAQYILNIVCHDFGVDQLTSTAQIIVDVNDINDNAPKFSQDTYYRIVMENNDPGQILMMVNASDPDEGVNAELTFSIQGEATRWFDIDPVSGIVKATRVLDREERSRHEVRLVVTDKGASPRSSSATLVVDVQDTNDMPPEFTQDLYSFGIHENEPEGAEVGYVLAEDLDDIPYNQFTFSLLSVEQGIMGAPFQISPDTGRITTTQVLDRETQQKFSVIVVAMDTSEPYFSSSATVSIYVMDRNDNPPRFVFPSQFNNTVYISNEVALGHVITHVEAEDADVDINGQIRYEVVYASQDGLFMIDTQTGAISVSADLHAMDNMTFFLSIVASDSGENTMSTSTKLNIIVNKTLAGLWAKTAGDVGSNVIIVVAVACVSGILIVALILAIVIMLRKQQHNQRKNNRHKSRMEALKIMSANEVTTVKSPATKPQYNSLNGQLKAGSQTDIGPHIQDPMVTEAVYSVPKKIISSKVDLSLEKSRQWLETLNEVNSKNDPETQSPQSVGGSSKMTDTTDVDVSVGHLQVTGGHRPPLKSCLKNPASLSCRKECGGGDNDSVNSGVVSNTDSGRGPSEQEDVSCRDVTFLPDGSQKHSSFRHKPGHHSTLPPSIPHYKGFYGNPDMASRTDASTPPRSTKDPRMYSGPHPPPQKTLLAEFLTTSSTGPSYPAHRTGTMHTFGKIPDNHDPRKARFNNSHLSINHQHLQNSPVVPPHRGSSHSTHQGQNSPPRGQYSVGDISVDDTHTNTSTLASSYRSRDDDEVSSTSGSYVVDAKELQQEIDDIFFKDLVV